MSGKRGTFVLPQLLSNCLIRRDMADESREDEAITDLANIQINGAHAPFS